MILFGTPNGSVGDNNDRAMWLTPPFDGGFGAVPRPPWSNPIVASASYPQIELNIGDQITINAYQPYIEIDGDTTEDEIEGEEQIEVDG